MKILKIVQCERIIGLHIFENNDKGNNTFNEKYENYKNFLIQNDELLLKSLEISDMHLLFESGRSLLSS